MTKRSWRDDICQKIFEGLRAACDDTVAFTEDWTRPIDAEYFASVHVAKQIAAINSGLGSPLKIYLETCARRFKEKCTPLLTSVPAANVTGKTSVFRGQASIGRVGRIDVAVTREGPMDAIPVCAIELKAFNPSRSSVITDLRRNAEYFEPGLTGASQIEFAALAAIRTYATTGSQEAKARKTFEGYAAAVPTPNSAVRSVSIARLRSGSIDEDGRVPQLIAGMIVYTRV